MAELSEPIAPEQVTADKAALRKQRWIVVAVVLAALVLITGLVLAVIALSSDPDAAANVRDIFIIFMAFESLIIGVALIVLVIQFASLINLLQNEVQPILRSTSDTVNTLRGTTEFLSENLVEPVIKLNSYLAGLRKLFSMFGIRK